MTRRAIGFVSVFVGSLCASQVGGVATAWAAGWAAHWEALDRIVAGALFSQLVWVVGLSFGALLRKRTKRPLEAVPASRTGDG